MKFWCLQTSQKANQDFWPSFMGQKSGWFWWRFEEAKHFKGGHINSTTDSPLLNMKMLVNCRAQCTTLKTSLIIETYCSLNKTLVQKARKLISQKSWKKLKWTQLSKQQDPFSVPECHKDRLDRICDILPNPTSVR